MLHTGLRRAGTSAARCGVNCHEVLDELGSRLLADEKWHFSLTLRQFVACLDELNARREADGRRTDRFGTSERDLDRSRDEASILSVRFQELSANLQVYAGGHREDAEVQVRTWWGIGRD
jgi:hypothetical protein